MAEMIRLGAYRKGSDESIDEAINIYPKIEKFLSQRLREKSNFDVAFKELLTILSSEINDKELSP